MRGLMLLVALGLVAPLGGCLHKAEAPRRTMFTVPMAFPDGTPTDAEVEDFERWLVDRAGGFTRITPARGGWMSPAGEVIVEDNHLYVVSISDGQPDAFRDDVERQVIDTFRQQEAWIERW
jgi:hypothetical protein